MTQAPPSDDGRERIAKRLARAGVASRRGAEALIAEGRVTVGGRRVETPATLVGPRDVVAVDGREIAPPEAPRLWRYHKPAGLVTTAADEKGRPTVFERLPPELPRVVSVGRLDLASEGLLLLTNDGALKRLLELPSTGWTRRYRLRVHGEPTEAALERLRRGIEVEGGERFRPMAVTLDRVQGSNAWLTIALREGRNRELRRAFGELGHEVSRLIRIGYGPFQLGDLVPGAVEEVRPRILRDQLGPALSEELGLEPPARASSGPEGERRRAEGAGPARRPAPGKPAGDAPRKPGGGGPARKPGPRKPGGGPGRARDRDDAAPARAAPGRNAEGGPKRGGGGPTRGRAGDGDAKPARGAGRDRDRDATPSRDAPGPRKPGPGGGERPRRGGGGPVRPAADGPRGPATRPPRGGSPRR